MSLETSTKPLAEVVEYLDDLLHLVEPEGSGEGLLIEGRPTVSKVGLAVNCSLQSIKGATGRGCDLLVTHHTASPSTDAHIAAQKHSRIRDAGLSWYVAHDSLDCAREFGTADALARALDVVPQGRFKPDGSHEFGIHGLTSGRFQEFVDRVGRRLGVPPRAWKNSDSFGRVGIVTGWGGRPAWMAEALSLGCDTFLTGEAVMFGMLFAREAGLNLVAAGHYATETPGVMALSARLSRELKLDVTFIPEEIVETYD
jgi:dinuclear metal center YbgI/SA1388 family protein